LIGNRFFETKVGSEISNLAPILAYSFQGEVSSPILFNIHTANQSTTSNNSFAEFVDDKFIYTSDDISLYASHHLKNNLNLLAN